jgi:predicted PurR-regulated permease PerM
MSLRKGTAAMTNGPPANSEPAPNEGAPVPTPIWIPQWLRLALIAIGVVLLVLALRRVPSVLTITLGGVAVAFVLSFPVRLLARVMPRPVAILLVFLLLIGTFVLALVVVIPFVTGQLTELVAAWPAVLGDLDRLLNDGERLLRSRGLLPNTDLNLSERLRESLYGRSQALAQNVLARLLDVVSGAVGFAVELFGIVFIAIYLLADVRTIRRVFLGLPPARFQADASALWDAFSDSIARYLIGVIFIATVQGGLAAVALWALGVPYFLLLGAWVAITSVIPYLGAYLGAIPSVLVALTISPFAAVLTLVIYVVLRELESEILTPRVQGRVVHMHPIIIFLAVIWAGQAYGLLGVVSAVPVLVVIRVLLDFFRARLRVRPAQAQARSGST